MQASGRKRSRPPYSAMQAGPMQKLLPDILLTEKVLQRLCRLLRVHHSEGKVVAPQTIKIVRQHATASGWCRKHTCLSLQTWDVQLAQSLRLACSAIERKALRRSQLSAAISVRCHRGPHFLELIVMEATFEEFWGIAGANSVAYKWTRSTFTLAKQACKVDQPISRSADQPCDT